MTDVFKKTILLVEDEAITAMIEKKQIEEKGYDVVHVFSGEEAVDTALGADAAVDLILMDIDLGAGMGGTEAAKRILDKLDIPLIFLSSHTEPEVVEKTEGITSYGYIVKNSGDVVLTASIKMVFRLFEARQQEKRHAAALQKNEAFLSGVLGSIQDGISVLDTDMNIVYVNPVMEKWYSDRMPLVGKRCYNCYHKADKPCDPCPTQRCMQSGRMEKDLVPGPGESEIEWVELHSYPMIDPETGRVEKVIEFVRDISDHKRYAQELYEEKQKLSTTLKSIGDAVISTDVKGNVDIMNGVAETLTGWQNKDARGKPLEEVFNIINSLTRCRVDNPVARVLSESGVVGLANHTVLISAGGEEYQIADSAAPILDEAGKIRGVVLVFRDVTEEYALEKALRNSEADMKMAQRMARLGSWRFDFTAGIVTGSAETRRSYGVGGEQLTIEDVQTIPLPEYRKMLDEALRALIAEGRPYDVEFRIKRPSDGALRYIHSIAEYDVDNNVVVGTIQDVTKRREAEDEIKKLLSENEIILQETHHRVKNNMNTIQSLLSLQAAVQDNPAANDILTDAAGRVHSMMLLYNKLYLSDSRGELNIRDVFPPLIEEMTSIFHISKNIKTDIHIDDITMKARSISSLGIIINELITNSMKYAFNGREDCRISLSITQESSRTLMIYKDNGPGLPDDLILEKASGFGMQLMSMLVQQLDGSIRIERDGGACFIIEF